MAAESQLDLLADAVLAAWEAGEAAPSSSTPAEARELRALMHAAELAALAFATSVPPMPAGLRARLQADGRTFCAERTGRRAGSRRAAFWSGALLGAAAGLAALLIPAFRGDVDPATARTRLLAAGASAIPWQAGPSATHGSIRGDVTWSDAQQAGWLRIEGLEPLDRDHQYQLWIVDGRRTGAPVDGGLFDLPSAGEHLLPIQARLPIGSAQAFVVTVEPRGGVVVSEQKDVVAIAKS